MLCLIRKPRQRILIDGGITLEVVRLSKGSVTIGITAPRDVAVMREEITQPKPNEVTKRAKQNIPLDRGKPTITA